MASGTLYDLVRSLRSEAATDFAAALTTLHTLITNVVEHPTEDKYRTIRLANATFHKRVGQYPSAISLLRSIGFEDANDSTSAAPGGATHLALPVADPALLASAATLVSAALEASKMVEAEGTFGASNGSSGGSAAAVASAAPVEASLSSSAAAAGGAAGAAASSSSSSGEANGPSARALGKRPMSTTPHTEQEPKQKTAKRAEEEEEAEDETEQTVGFAVELESYTADAIDSYFLDVSGGPFLSRFADAKSVDKISFTKHVATARDAVRITKGMGDKEAEARAAHWASALEEHGRLLGWSVEDVGEEAADEGGGSSGGGGSAAAANVAPEPEVIAEDGNFDSCAICGEDGLLICCEACPQAYHAACLGSAAPPDDEDDEAAWFCPPCAAQLGMVGA